MAESHLRYLHYKIQLNATDNIRLPHVKSKCSSHFTHSKAWAILLEAVILSQPWKTEEMDSMDKIWQSIHFKDFLLVMTGNSPCFSFHKISKHKCLVHSHKWQGKQPAVIWGRTILILKLAWSPLLVFLICQHVRPPHNTLNWNM